MATINESVFDFIDDLRDFWDKYGDTDIVRSDTLADDILEMQAKFNGLDPVDKQDIFVYMLGKVNHLLGVPG